MYLGYVTNGSATNPLYSLISTLDVVSLVTHLSSHTVLLSQLLQQASFVDRVGKWFLNIYVLAHGDGFGSDDSMGVVGSSYHHSIDAVAHLAIHLAIVLELFSVWVSVHDRFCITPVNIGNSYDVFCFHTSQNAGTTATYTNCCNIQFVGRSCVSMTLA